VYTRLEAKAGFREARTAKFTAVTKRAPLRSEPKRTFRVPEGFLVRMRKKIAPMAKRRKERA
jgi:hypothetical protein